MPPATASKGSNSTSSGTPKPHTARGERRRYEDGPVPPWPLVGHTHHESLRSRAARERREGSGTHRQPVLLHAQGERGTTAHGLRPIVSNRVQQVLGPKARPKDLRRRQTRRRAHHCVRVVSEPGRKAPAHKREARDNASDLAILGSPYQIRTGDLRLERAAS